jgi:DNA modification methylase
LAVRKEPFIEFSEKQTAGETNMTERNSTLLDYQDPKDARRYMREQQTALIKKMKSNQAVPVPDIPLFEIPRNSTLFITSKNVAYSSHGIHEFPAKFIPQVPRWALLKYCKKKGVDRVLDPFCGCGTTLVEARLLGFNSYGVDIDPMARLLTSVKTSIYDKEVLQVMRREISSEVWSAIESDPTLPEFPNRTHWFSDEVSKGIAIVRNAIESVCDDSSIRDFFYVCLSAIIRGISYADPDQIFPEKTTWGMKKKTQINRKDVFSRFELSVGKFIPKVVDFSTHCHGNTEAKLIQEDATNIKLQNNAADVAVTSPPYINALDYPRVNQLEMYWLGLLDGQKKIDLKKKYIGTEAVSSKNYAKLNLLDEDRYQDLNDIMKAIYEKDKLRAYVVYRFFVDMKTNFEEVYRVLKPQESKKRGRYVVIIGDGAVRKIPIPTHEILGRIGEEVGFKVENVFSYVIRHRTLLITRSEHSGKIDKDWVTVLAK